MARPDANRPSGPLLPPRPPALPPLPWSTIAAGGLAGVLVLALFLVPAGSTVAIAGLTVAAVALATAAVALRRRGRARPAGGQVSRSSQAAARRDAAPPARPAPSPPRVAPGPPAPPQDVPAPVARVAQRLAEDAADRLAAPACAVLVVQGKRLVPAGSAGDWSVARRLAGEDDRFSLPGSGRTPADDDPPQLPLDDQLPLLLALYPRAVPVERWRTLDDVPPFLLPLAALADAGAGALISLCHRRRLTGMYVIARRPGGREYTDAELAMLERLAQEGSAALAAALAGRA